MKILLLRPPYRINRYSRNVPLSYLALAAWLDQHGHEAVIVDRILPNQSEECLHEQIRCGDFGLIGIGVMTCDYEDALQEAALLKQNHPDIPIVFGGAHATGNPAQCLASGVVDYVVSGEGEAPLLALMDALERGVWPDRMPGISYMKNGEAVIGEPAAPMKMFQLPVPAYSKVDLEAYFRLDPPWHFPRSRRVIQFMTSRGCPYQCSYCHRIHGKVTRLLPADQVLDQMQMLRDTYGVREFIIVDDVFNIDLNRAKAICRGIIERQMNIYLQFPNGLRGDVFDEELMSLLAAANTHYLAVAVETASDRLQRLIGKNLNIEKALQTVHLANKYKIEVGGFFMIGFPSETRKELEDTFKLAFNNPFDVAFFSIVTPYEGTQLRQDILDGVFGDRAMHGLKEDQNAEFPVIYSESVTRDMLFSLRRTAYLKFYAHPRRIYNLLRKMIRPAHARQILSAVFRRLFLNGRTTVT